MADPTQEEYDAAREAFWNRVPPDPRPPPQANGHDFAPPDESGREPLKVIYADDITADMQPPPQIVEDLLCEGEVCVFYGPSQAGKTTLVAYLAVCVATGRPFLGKRVRQGAVVYVASEVPVNVMRRIQGTKIHDALDSMPLVVVCESIDLYGGGPGGGGELADVSRIVDCVNAFEVKTGDKVKLVVVDTLARSCGDGDENSTHDMGIVTRNLSLVANATGANVTVVHHTGRAENAKHGRGSSVIYSNTDCEIACEYNETTNIRTITIIKQRNLGTEGATLAARFERIELGQDEWGKALTVSVVEPADMPDVRNVPRPSGANQKIALEALAKPLAESRQFGKGDAPPLWPCIDLEEGVRIVGSALTCEDRRRAERARLAIAGLVGNGVLGSRDGWIWRR